MEFLMLFAILFPMAAALGICGRRVSGDLRLLHGYVFGAALVNSMVLLYVIFSVCILTALLLI